MHRQILRVEEPFFGSLFIDERRSEAASADSSDGMAGDDGKSRCCCFELRRDVVTLTQLAREAASFETHRHECDRQCCQREDRNGAALEDGTVASAEAGSVHHHEDGDADREGEHPAARERQHASERAHCCTERPSDPALERLRVHGEADQDWRGQRHETAQVVLVHERREQSAARVHGLVQAEDVCRARKLVCERDQCEGYRASANRFEHTTALMGCSKHSCGQEDGDDRRALGDFEPRGSRIQRQWEPPARRNPVEKSVGLPGVDRLGYEERHQRGRKRQQL